MRLDLATRTLFSEFQEIVFSRTAILRKIKKTKTFVKKTIKGKVYWYQQHYEYGKSKQCYFGPSNKENDELVDAQRKKSRKDKALVKKLTEQEQRQANMLHRGGLPALDRRMANLLSKLSETLLIDKFGVLIGTFSFLSYSGMLGALFDQALLKTNDIDIARDDLIEIAAAGTVRADDLFSQSGMQCHAVPPLSHKALPSSFITSDGIRIDFLVPLRGREKKNIKMPNVIGAGAIPMRFLDYLIDEPIRTVLIAPTGGIPVQVPSPSRFAIHKLIVASYRPATETSKKGKDLNQAGQLIRILAEERPAQLRKAYKEAWSRGKRWQKAINNSMGALPKDIGGLLS